MTSQKLLLQIMCIIAVALLVGCATSKTDGNVQASMGIDYEADRIIHRMCQSLTNASAYTFQADVTYDSMIYNQYRVQYGGTSKLTVQRPNKLFAAYEGDERKSKFYYNGKTITILDTAKNLYAITQVPPTIDEALDTIFDKYGFSVPIADLIYSDPYNTFSENTQSGMLVGHHEIDGAMCDHLVFSNENISWQIWVEQGKNPVPRKLLITYKREPGSPQYTARLSNWNFKPNLTDQTFNFTAPEGADEIEFLPINQSEVK